MGEKPSQFSEWGEVGLFINNTIHFKVCYKPFIRMAVSFENLLTFSNPKVYLYVHKLNSICRVVYLVTLQICLRKHIHTKMSIVFKQNVYAVNVVNGTKVYFPPRVFAWWACSFCDCICPHTSVCISINCITCFIIVMWRRGRWEDRWLGGECIEGQIICRIHWKLFWLSACTFISKCSVNRF